MKPVITLSALALSIASLYGCGGGGAAASTASGAGGPAAAAGGPDSTSTSVGSPSPSPTPSVAPTPAPTPHPSPGPSPHPSPTPTPSGSTPTPAPVAGGNITQTQTTTITISQPIAITYDPTRNVIYEAEAGGDIKQVSLGGNVSTVATGVPAPSALAVQPAGPLYVSSATDRSDGSGTVSRVDPSNGAVTPLLSGFYVEGLVVQADGTVALSKNIPTPGEDSGVWVFNPTNGDLTQTGGDLEGPRGLTRIGSALIVLNTGSDYSHAHPAPCEVHRVGGGTVAGEQQCSGGPIGSKAQGVASDAAGNLYIADTPNNEILKVTSGGAVSVLAGNGTAGDVDANGSAAEFNTPNGICLASDGNLYVADTGNNAIRRITLSGSVSTLVG